MELLDFAVPQDPALLVREAAADIGLEQCAELPAVGEEFGQMVARFKGEPLWHELATSAQLYRELDFTVRVGPARLRGKIDLLFERGANTASEDAGETGIGAHAVGTGFRACPAQPGKAVLPEAVPPVAALPGAVPPSSWHIVDYKSDKVDRAHLAEHCKRYALQMTVYWLAMQRHLGAAPASARLYFLRLGQSVEMGMEAEAMQRCVSQVEALCRDLIHCRRTGEFARHVAPHCRFCPYESLCNAGMRK
jgi:CRISPR/Cas system-associated exonuclease Cas4 (RecB family)